MKRGLVYYTDDPSQMVVRLVYLLPGEPESVLDEPHWLTDGLDPTRPTAMVKVEEDDPRVGFGSLMAPPSPPKGLLPNCGWVGSPDEAIEAAMLFVDPEDTFCDLGCGDGRVLAAAKAKGASVVGIDLDPLRIAESRGRVGDVDLRLGDLRTCDLPGTAFYGYLGNEAGAILVPRLRALAVGTCIVTFQTTLGDWEPTSRNGDIRHWVV